MLRMYFTRLHVLSQPRSKTRDSFVLWKFFPCFLQCNFFFFILALDEFFKNLLYRSPDMIFVGGSNMES